MPLFRRASDLPLAKDPSSRFLVWITALMVYLAALSLAGAMMASEMAGRLSTGLSGGLTVQIAPLSGTNAPPLAERVESALTVLRASAGVRGASALPPSETSRLLEPWLGPDAAADPNLPVPVLIDVATDGTVDVAGLRERLKSAAPGATVDDHASWLADLRGFAGAVELAAIGVVLVVGGAGLMAVVFAVRAGLAIHRKVVELLHLMGATDRYVSRQFETHILGLSLQGGLSGAATAALTLIGLERAGGGLTGALVPDLTLGPWQWLALALVPLAAAALAVLTARWTVLRTLEDLP